MDFEKWKAILNEILINMIILAIVIGVVATISQCIVNAAHVNSIVNAYKKIGQILPFS